MAQKRYDLQAGYLRLHTHTLRIRNNDCFSHSNNSGTNGPQCYANCILSALFVLKDADIKTLSVYKLSRIGRKCVLMKSLGK